jgi:hypothetical protein
MLHIEFDNIQERFLNCIGFCALNYAPETWRKFVGQKNIFLFSAIEVQIEILVNL